jgi:hypothetical protein
MFFLITYAMINVVVLIEQSLGLASFRPLLRIPRFVSLSGAAGCLFVMFIVNPIFSLVAVTVVIIVYGVLIRHQMKSTLDDVRSGLFASIAEWAAGRASDLPTPQERAWRPSLLVPTEDPGKLRGEYQFIRDITRPEGYVKLLGLMCDNEDKHLPESLPSLARNFRKEDVFASWMLLEADEFGPGVLNGMQALSGSFFRPNVVLLSLPQKEDKARENELEAIIGRASENGLGILLFADHSKAGLGSRNSINIWVTDHDPEWKVNMDLGDLDLAILIGFKLKRNWNGSLKFITPVRDDDQIDAAKNYLSELVELVRMPDAEFYTPEYDFEDCLVHAPQADLNVFCLSQEPDFDSLHHILNEVNSSCVFAHDSGEENALA